MTALHQWLTKSKKRLSANVHSSSDDATEGNNNTDNQEEEDEDEHTSDSE